MGTVSRAIALSAFLLLGAGMQAPSRAVPAETINFNHQLHLSDDVGAECTTCHPAEESGSSADRLLPTMDTCAECHDVEDDESCEMCHRDPDEAGEIDVPVRKIIFAHKAHLQYEGVGCKTCHGDKAETTQPGGSHLPAMATCSTCHVDRKAPDACEACHTELTGLTPESHTASWALEHGRRVRSGDSSCAPCHNEATCEACHDAAQIPGDATAIGSLTAFAPKAGGQPGLALKSAHNLNYVFTHPLDARGKERECALCHETSAFCVECHQREAAGGAFKPRSHGDPNWGAIAGAVGSGGGRHAQLARRDMENCAACHDVEGDDPVCILCHADRTPGLGNDPKTHGSGFKSRAGHGSFHSDPNAICYNCHASGLSGVGTRLAGGPGFCGYCHGRQ